MRTSVAVFCGLPAVAAKCGTDTLAPVNMIYVRNNFAPPLKYGTKTHAPANASYNHAIHPKYGTLTPVPVIIHAHLLCVLERLILLHVNAHTSERRRRSLSNVDCTCGRVSTELLILKHNTFMNELQRKL